MSIKPKFSILCPCYNHERYVGSFLKGILEQSYPDFELIIVDDCSIDKTVEVINLFSDKRIKLIQHDYNKGVNAALNTAFENSSGDYLIFLASDDILESFALEKYRNIFEIQKIDAVYINLSVIDENDNLRQDYCNSSLPFLENESCYYLLHKMFFEGNSLYSPGLALSRNLMNRLYPLPPANSIYQDYKMNVEILASSKFVVLPDKLVKYRIVNDGKSLSSNNNITYMRCSLEEDSLMDSFLIIHDMDLLKNVFKKEIADTGIVPFHDTIKFFLGRMALLSSIRGRKIWGYHKIMEFYNENLNKDILKNKYNFVYKDLLGLVDYFESSDLTLKTEKIKLNTLERFFSIKKSSDKMYKQICLLGLKFMIRL